MHFLRHVFVRHPNTGAGARRPLTVVSSVQLRISDRPQENHPKPKFARQQTPGEKTPFEKALYRGHPCCFESRDRIALPRQARVALTASEFELSLASIKRTGNTQRRTELRVQSEARLLQTVPEALPGRALRKDREGTQPPLTSGLEAEPRGKATTSRALVQAND